MEFEQQKSFPVVNLHTDVPFVHGYRTQQTGELKNVFVRNDPKDTLVLNTPSGKTHLLANGFDIPRALDGLDERNIITNLAAFLCPPDPVTGDNSLPTGKLVDAYQPFDEYYASLVEGSNGTMIEINSHLDLDQLIASNKIGFLRSIEGLYGEFTLDELTELTKKNKIITLMWNFNNPDTGAAAKFSGTEDDTGLTANGKVVTEIISENSALCLSHSSDKTAHDILDITEKKGKIPAIATHSGSRTLLDHKRNLTDDLAKRIARQGGIIGIPAVPLFVGPNVVSLVDHIQYLAELGLIDSLAFGPDFDGVSSGVGVIGVEDCSVAGKNIATEMRSRGFSEGNIRGVLGKNALRFIQRYLLK